MIASLGGIAAMIAAIFGAILMFTLTIFLGIALFNVSTILVSLRTMIDDMDKETVPLLSEVTTTVKNVNRELDSVHGVTESAGKIAQSAQRVSKVVETTVSSPLIKVAAAGYGFTRARQKMQER